MNLLLPSLLAALTSIYTLSFTSTDGSSISFNQYQGKKILLVNIATNSPRASQLGELQQLQQQYSDSLIIIAFPSNSFGHELRSDSAIKQYCINNYGALFQIAQKGSVKDFGMLSIYQWLSHISENGAVDGVVRGDFQKFLIDEGGHVVGIFAPSVSPTNQTIKDAINSHYE